MRANEEEEAMTDQAWIDKALEQMARLLMEGWTPEQVFVVLRRELEPLLEAGQAMADEERDGVMMNSIMSRSHRRDWFAAKAKLLRGEG